MKIEIRKAVLAHNDDEARENARWFSERGIVAVNVMASPGAGKTSLILALAKALPSEVSPLVIEADCASSIDAEKVAAAGIPVVQINTEGGCHLEAGQVRGAANNLPKPDRQGILFIENIGNLICPAAFDLGEAVRLVVASVPEGHDKPVKYPDIFALADVVVLNKIDVLPHFEFDRSAFTAGVRAVNATAPIIEVSCRNGQGIDPLLRWLISCRPE